MKIYHFANSFISAEEGETLLTCDPWIGTTSDNGWYSYPIKKANEIPLKIFKSNFVYISHLHCDHLDFKTLSKFKNKNLTFVIKKFKNGVLKRRLQRFSNRIIEIEPWKKTKINKDFSVAIIPQIISNSSDLPDNIEYDLDTSIVIQSNKNKSVFYNNVDMPMNINVLRKIKNFIHSKFKKNIDVFCYALGAASEFPQCFLNVNRKYEKNRIIKKSLDEINSYLRLLKPRIFFPAGGTYSIYGKFYNLNKYIAQPSFEEIEKSTFKLKSKVLNLIGGGHVSVDKNKHYHYSKSEVLNRSFNNDFINKIKNINYYYKDKNQPNYNLNQLDKNFSKAKKNYFRIVEKNKKIDSYWNINFNIYKKYAINSNCKIDKKKSSFLKTYKLKNYSKNKNKIDKLDCYIEYQLFNSLIKGKFPWNTSLSGSTIMYKRKPNKFNVDMMFSLNFLRA